jgi:hypothetical protein
VCSCAANKMWIEHDQLVGDAAIQFNSPKTGFLLENEWRSVYENEHKKQIREVHSSGSSSLRLSSLLFRDPSHGQSEKTLFCVSARNAVVLKKTIEK